jgi:WD40 repeat protein
MQVWHFKGGIKSFESVRLPAAGTCVCKLSTRFMIGTACGSVHVIDMISGAMTLSLNNAIHSDYVRTLQPSSRGMYVISSSKDGTVKVWDTDGKLLLALMNLQRMQCACFLSNDDILIGSGRQAEIIRQPFDISNR